MDALDSWKGACCWQRDGSVTISEFRGVSVGNSVILLSVLTVSFGDGCVKFPRIEGIRLARAHLTLP